MQPDPDVAAAWAAYRHGDRAGARAILARSAPARPGDRRAILAAALDLHVPDAASALGWLDAVLLAADEGAAPAGDKLELRLLGAFDVAIGGVPIARWPRRKAKLALAALVLHPDGLAPADFGDLFGEELTPTIARVAVLNLRRTLEPALDNGEDSRYVRFVDGRYALDPGLLVAPDLTRFEAAIARGEADAAGGWRELEAALAIYRGNLLEEPYYASFFVVERERVRQQALDALLRLADRDRGEGRHDAAEARLRRAITLAPDQEQVHIALMRHYHAQGRAMMARKAYWDARKALQQHLGLETVPELEAAHLAIARG